MPAYSSSCHASNGQRSFDIFALCERAVWKCSPPAVSAEYVQTSNDRATSEPPEQSYVDLFVTSRSHPVLCKTCCVALGPNFQSFFRRTSENLKNS